MDLSPAVAVKISTFAEMYQVFPSHIQPISLVLQVSMAVSDVRAETLCVVRRLESVFLRYSDSNTKYADIFLEASDA